jgi:hypothetical protein
MKRIILLNTLFLFVFLSQAQNDSIFVSVSTTKMNVLYIGVDNPIDIGISNLCGQQAEVTISDGKIEYRGKGEYFARVKNPGMTTISISYILNGEKVTVKKEFRAKRIPSPIVKLGGIANGKIDKSLLLAQKGLSVEIEDFDFDLHFAIQSFSIVIKDKFENTIPSNSSSFTQDQYALMKKLKKGDTLYIEDIRAIGPSGEIRDLGTCEFIIK